MTTPAFRNLRYDKEIIGVDLGTHAVKVVQLRVAGDKAKVVGYAREEVAPLLSEAPGEEGRRAVYAQVLQKILANRAFTAKGAAFTVSGNAAIIRFLRLTKPVKMDAATGLPAEALPLSPFPPEESNIEVRTLSEDDGHVEAMAVFAQKSAVNGAIAVIQGTRLRPAVALNDALALENAFQFLNPAPSTEPVVLLNIGAATSTLLIVENGTLKATRTFNIAGDAWTRAIRRDLGLSPEDAENLKREYGLFGHLMAGGLRQTSGPSEASRIYNETSVRVFRAVEPLLTDLAMGINHTIEAFLEKRTKNQLPVSKILLSGGGASLKSIQEVLGAKTSLTVEPFSPLSQVGFSSPEDGAAALEAAVPFGLALSGALRVVSTQPRPNLLPPEAKRAASRRNSARAAGLFLLTLASLWAVFRIYEYFILERAALDASRLIANPKPVPKPPPTPAEAPAAVKRAGPAAPKPPARFSYLHNLRFTGAFGDVLMLTGPEGDFTVRGNQLFGPAGDVIPGVSASVSGEDILLTADRERYSISTKE